MERELDQNNDALRDAARGYNDAGQKVDEFGNAVEDSADEAEESGNKFEKLGGVLAGVGKAIGAAMVAVGAATAAAAVAVVKGINECTQVFADFDDSMRGVAATMGMSAEQIKNGGGDWEVLNNAAKEAGINTKFMASEAADALGYMAMAGWKADQAVAGLPGVLNLAAASGADLATTSDIVTDALTAFGMKAEDSGDFADLLAAASSNANTNVEMLGESFKYAAPVMGSPQRIPRSPLVLWQTLVSKPERQETS